MGEQVSWLVELAIKPGALESFRKLTAEMVAHTHREAGTLVYERYLSLDEQTTFVYERYSDSEAAVDHLLNFDVHYGNRFAEMAERKQVLFFGEPSSELKP